MESHGNTVKKYKNAIRLKLFSHSCGKTWKKNRRAPQRVINITRKIIGHPFPSLKDLYSTRCLKWVHSMVPVWGTPAFYLLPSERFGHRQINPGTVFTTRQWLWSLLIPDMIWLAIFLCLCLCTHISFLHLLYIFYSVLMLFIVITACFYFSMSVGQHSNLVDMIFLFMSLPFFPFRWWNWSR